MQLERRYPLPGDMLVTSVALTVLFILSAAGAETQDAAARIPAARTPVVFHVAPNGDDAGKGSREEPFASLERARNAIRSLRGNGPLPVGGALVLVHGGQFAVKRTLSFTVEDSGSEDAPVCYCAVSGEAPLFRGGIGLKGRRPLSDTNSFTLLSAESRSKVWVLDLKAIGVTNLLPLKLGGFASGNGFRTHPAHELFFNGKALQLARGPNEGFLRISEVAVKDGTKVYDRQGSKVGKFLYEGDRPKRWIGESELLLYGYWFWDWADSYERVASIDPEQRLITLAEPWHKYGFSIDAPFYAINAVSELDAPGEWYLDRVSGQVLIYPPSDPTSAVIEFSMFAEPMVELRNVSHVSFEGLTWELGSADAIKVSGGSHVQFAGCTIRHFAGNGLEIRGGQNHSVLSCDIRSMGRGGIVLSGGNRKTLTPGSHVVENCDIHDLSRIDHTYTPAIILDGVGNRIAHNRLHDVLSSALRVGGNDHLIEYNEVFNVVLESDDQGGADMYGNPTFRGNVYRFNYWHHIGNWRATGDQPKCGQAGIRLDDAICGTRIYGNIFERCSAGKLGFGGVQIHGGKDNVIENNLFVDCAAAVSFSSWSESRWQEFVKDVLDKPDVDRALYLKRYPELVRLAENPNANLVRSNLAVRCGELLRRAPKSVQVSDNTMLSKGELTLKPDNPLFNRPGLAQIPVEKIGLYRDAWRGEINQIGQAKP